MCSCPKDVVKNEYNRKLWHWAIRGKIGNNRLLASIVLCRRSFRKARLLHEMSVHPCSFAFPVNSDPLLHFRNIKYMDNARPMTSIRRWQIQSISDWSVVPITDWDWPIPMNRSWKTHLYSCAFRPQIGEWVFVYSVSLLKQRNGQAGRCCRFDRYSTTVGRHYRERNVQGRFVLFDSQSVWFHRNLQQYVTHPDFVWISFSVRRSPRNLSQLLLQNVSRHRKPAGHSDSLKRL